MHDFFLKLKGYLHLIIILDDFIDHLRKFFIEENLSLRAINNLLDLLFKFSKIPGKTL